MKGAGGGEPPTGPGKSSLPEGRFGELIHFCESGLKRV